MTAKQPFLRLVAPPGPDVGACSDDELMQLVRAGVRSAMATLVRRHQVPLRAYCARRCGAAVGDEVAQEVFVALWTAGDAYEPRGRFKAYLFTLAERRCKNALKAGVRHATALERAQHQAPEERTQLDVLLADERQRRLFAKLERLSRDQHRAILLRYVAGLDYDDIASVVGRSPETVRTRVFLGLRRLRKWMGEP